jgi:phospho-N-acetylmuramoyl-pentapeptide-transferase
MSLQLLQLSVTATVEAVAKISSASGISLGKSLIVGTISLITVLLIGPMTIRRLRRNYGERIASDSARLNELHAGKSNTPTMGGLMIIMGILAGLLSDAFISRSWLSPMICLAIVFLLSLAALGGYDDWVKLRTSKKGITPRQKLAGQTIIALFASTGLAIFHGQTQFSPAESVRLFVFESPWLFIPWSTFVIVATSNAVNLTDGLDGLAAGCVSISSIALVAILLILAETASSVSAAMLSPAFVLSASLLGSSLGFLWFNRHPAQVFMGDTGSLPLGGLLALITLACRIELLLVLIAGVSLVETLSVMLQVAWYRRTRRRILLCSPLHNHFVFQGTAESRIVASFWAAAVVTSASAVILVRMLS